MKTKQRASWLLIPALAFALTACTGGGGDAGGSGTSDEVEESSPTSSGLVEVTDTPGSVEGYVGALEDSEQSRCESSADGWVSEGTLTNSTDAVQSYRVYVSFIAKGDTKGLVQADAADVAPGESTSWVAEAALDGDVYECVLRVERFEP